MIKYTNILCIQFKITAFFYNNVANAVNMRGWYFKNMWKRLAWPHPEIRVELTQDTEPMLHVLIISSC